MNQFDQLLTCAICLDRYRNPKLLPCQHSFCMEPCMEGLVDYVRRQVKCPECRAETRIPYNGVQAFPTNVTLTRFLELHIELTGEIPDPTTNQIMERCQVCSEKAYCLLCAHCDKKVCSECKEAHMDVLKREITRISNQVRRVLHRLEDSIGLAEKNTLLIQQNSLSVIEEIDEIYRRLAKALKDRTEFMKHEVERYLQTELKNLTILKYNMEQEVGNIVSNCDLVDKYVSPESTGATTQWDDVELMDTKDIFLRTMEFIRAFEYEPGDYARRVRFSMNQDPNNLAVTLGTFGDLHLPSSGTLSLGQANVNTLSVHSQAGSQSGLMRSKSDHRLTSQYRGADYDVESSGRTSPVFGRKFGERDQKKQHKESNPYPEMEHMEVPSTDRKSRFRSRFTRNLVDSFDDSGEGQGSSGRGVRFNENETKKERERVLDTEDVARGPLSGITRLLDSPRVIQRVQEADAGPKPVKPAPTPVAVAPVAVAPAPVAPWRTTSRQVSEEDEITKQKKANKMEAAAAAKPAAVQPPPRRQASTEPRTVTERTSSSRNPSESTAAEPSIDAVQTAVDVVPTNSAAETTARLRNKLSPERYPAPKKNRSESSDSGTSETSSGSSPARTGTGTTATGTRVAPPTTPPTPASASSTAARPNFQSRFLGRTQTPKTSIESKKEESSSSEEEDEEEESDDDDEDEESDEEVVPAVEEKKPEKLSRMEKTDIGPLLARSAHEREQRNLGSRQNSTSNASATSYTKKESPPNTVASYRRTRDAVTRVTSPPEREIGSRYGTQSGSSASNPSSTYSSGRYNTRTGSTDYSPAGASLARSRSTVYSTPTEDPVTPSRYSSSSSSSGLANKYLNRSRHTFDDDTTPSSRYDEEQQASVGGSSSRRLPKDKKTKVSKSKSSHDVLAGIGRSQSHDEDAVYLPQSSRSQRRRKASLNPDKDFQPGDDESNSSLSSWARYLKTKYGKGSTKSFDGGAGASASEEHASTASELRPKRASFSQPSAAQYMGKSRVQLKFGSRGSEPGKLTWPRGICCTENGPDGSTQIVVADSTNHRICVFDSNGTFLKEFGSYGSGDGEFDCPGAVWVNRIGQFIVSDRYNHRVQVFDPSGRFLRSFGSQGETPGKFSYPLGVTTDALNFIYVCEESRIQVFQSDGTFVGKFGSLGSKVGEISHPHYIAITSTNKIIVSDTNNSRIQIFDINGKVLSCIGGEGSDEGLLKAPRGVAVDESGYIIVADSGNNRIQIFSPDGVFLKSFGSWAGDSQEFKGLEGLAVANGNIYAVDRVNHCVIVL